MVVSSSSGIDAGALPDVLRVRVGLLGRHVGEVLRRYARPKTFQYVEQLRALTRQRRTNRSEVEGDIDALLEQLDVPDCIDVLRAFWLYFLMVNLAEDLYRERRRRERVIVGESPPRGALDTLSSIDAAEFSRLDIQIVFTAHPTEVRRRTTSEKLVAIANTLRQSDERELTAEEASGLDDELHAQIALLWQSNELYATAPTVSDEVRNLLARFPKPCLMKQ
jgi:phosphoenolpyruvate carboxylase